MRQALQAEGAELKACWGGTLFHVDDLPFDLSAMPSCYGDFRQRVKALPVRPALKAPQTLKPLPASGWVLGIGFQGWVKDKNCHSRLLWSLVLGGAGGSAWESCPRCSSSESPRTPEP